MQIRYLAGAAVLTFGMMSLSASAATVTDPAGDFLASFTGAHDADLDVLSFSVSFNSATSEFRLGAVLGDVINPARAGLYVIGVNTGLGAIAPFAAIGAPNVKFDQVVVIQKNGTGFVTGATGGALSGGAISIVGNQFIAHVPLALLASTGFDPLHYGWNLWPRTGLGGNDLISDFAPDNAVLAIAGAPEPTTWALLVTGFGLVGVAARRRKAEIRAMAA